MEEWILKYNKFRSFIPNSFFLLSIRRYLSAFPLEQSDSFRSCHESNFTIYLTIYLLDSYESAWLSLVKIHGFSKIKTTWPIRLKTMSFPAQLHNSMKYGKGGVCLRFSVKIFYSGKEMRNFVSPWSLTRKSLSHFWNFTVKRPPGTILWLLQL
jgi:hypothetical protein